MKQAIGVSMTDQFSGHSVVAGLQTLAGSTARRDTTASGSSSFRRRDAVDAEQLNIEYQIFIPPNDTGHSLMSITEIRRNHKTCHFTQRHLRQPGLRTPGLCFPLPHKLTSQPRSRLESNTALSDFNMPT
mmetsp:Transcript_54073/g.143966  ORF Transcript_54073/g.143966 Transcript_54073/m.143966 type:complete len:130 (-) Transcript_54073:97-486(-)